MSRTVIITKEEAEKMGREQVKKQNDLSGAHNYKFIRVGSLNECWQGYERNKYHNLHKSLLVWRLDGAEWSSEIDEGGYTKTNITYVKNKNLEYWFVVADYAENSPIWKEFLHTMSPSHRQFLRDSNRMHRKIEKRLSN